jgi:hypothetical protein
MCEACSRTKLSVTQLQRLAYQPQPIPTAAQGFDPSALLEVFDWSVLWLENDACCFLERSQFSDWQVFQKHLEHIGIHFLTVLDTAACLPLPAQSATVTAIIDAINLLLKHFESCKYMLWYATHTEDLFKNRRNRCRILAFIQRAIFYQARLKGKTMAEYDAYMERRRIKLDIPLGFEILKQLKALLDHYEAPEDGVNEVFNEATELEWVGPLIVNGCKSRESCLYTSENKEQSRKGAKPEAEVKPGTNIYTGHDKSHG